MNGEYLVKLVEILHIAEFVVKNDFGDNEVENAFKEIAKLVGSGAAVVGMPVVPAKVIPHDEPAAEVPRTEAEKQRQRMLKHFSICNGLFPIHTVRTPSGSMGKCEINGRKFSFTSLDSTGPNETPSCTVDIRDGDKKVALMTVLRGKSIAEKMAMGVLKAYIKQLSGSKKFHGRGGFLKQALKRHQEKEAANG